MSQPPLTVSFGDELSDGYKVVDAWLNNGIKWLEDIQSFYQERSIIEREYSQKLAALSSKYFEKKARLSTALSVGDEPQITPGSLENASLVTWTEILSQTEVLAKAKGRLASELSLQVADPLGSMGHKYQELRARFQAYDSILVDNRDSFYSELKKGKSKYDQSCQAVETTRLKGSKLFDRSQDKQQRRLEEKQHEMNVAKNNYLIKINIANRVKDKYYHQDVPELLDRLQELNEARVRRLNGVWTLAASLESTSNDRSLDALTAMLGVVEQNVPSLDSVMFAKHNVPVTPWVDPADFVYEPSPIWHDDDTIITNDEYCLRHLRTQLATSQRIAAEYNQNLEARYGSFRELDSQKESLKDNPAKSATFDEYMGRSLLALQQLTVTDTKRVAAEVELETIELAVGDRDLSAVPPLEKKKRRFLFGHLESNKNSSHSGEAGHNNNDNSRHSNDIATDETTTHPTHGGSILAKGVAKLGLSRSKSTAAEKSNATVEMARALYDYTPSNSGEDELEMYQHDTFIVLHHDDGSGWVNVKHQATGETGLVPATYIEMIAPTEASVAVTRGRTDSLSSIATSGSGAGRRRGPAVAPKRGAKMVSYMIALYDYDAQSDVELTIREGDKILVVAPDSGDGWTEGECNGMSGIFPTSYAKSI
ncbi:FCH-domain-containing protein [Nadsonia fulvescens var. elongata DSM 6958]|uniref:Protein BZZ1 n=1 Tax=Nadsonia fulvescens var. elongata DSM 6958 TaxID=857566 RepID=A0A1E3PDW0_9ASCO|nr:FCH-domain-containing protein [Nadsonia fulvescens var. elongata DSM 6958]